MSNPYFFQETGSPKHKNIDISDVKNQTLGSLWRAGVRSISVEDKEYEDFYFIRFDFSKRFGLSGICSLNRRASYQAGFKAGSQRLLKDVVNDIAGGAIL